MSRSLGAVAGGGEDQQSGPGAVSFQHCRSRGMARGGGSTLHISVGGEMMLQTVQHTIRQMVSTPGNLCPGVRTTYGWY